MEIALVVLAFICSAQMLALVVVIMRFTGALRHVIDSYTVIADKRTIEKVVAESRQERSAPMHEPAPPPPRETVLSREVSAELEKRKNNQKFGEPMPPGAQIGQ